MPPLMYGLCSMVLVKQVVSTFRRFKECEKQLEETKGMLPHLGFCIIIIIFFLEILKVLLTRCIPPCYCSVSFSKRRWQ